MKRQVYETDGLGFIKEIYVKEFDDEGNCLEELNDNIVTMQPPNGLYRAKWNGTEWIEGMTKEEIGELNNQPSLPSVEERLQMTENTILGLMNIIIGGM